MCAPLFENEHLFRSAGGIPQSNTSNFTSILNLLSATFSSFCEIQTLDMTRESVRKRISTLEEHWQSCGLNGHSSLQALSDLKAHIRWEAMSPDQFYKFYRYVFHICKESKKKHIKLPTALAAWQLLLPGRFRLLDRWCDFIVHKGKSLLVINEDQWWQVVDFSRTIHEDLSNFDPSGAWTVLIDEFVEFVRTQHSATAM
ncbi:hypothetical protein CEUSTIGMA_g9443.t1 [Chlamydomonas eustigma]|uniref:Defective in cullin neddylation protein n=1 Tax=Chlamydomonas eustigma TaxID=1157962 RepID=A0A250XG05_9CHLO|nr:hypothetical protein CEUSTIGMA_g9443.t1 [Chlamydomonas eustigma]|eukprot:GAX82015.1 hypothetical protein CEUSTIGMA_g9443.t1 [Chlamydomonas eustigma]